MSSKIYGNEARSQTYLLHRTRVIMIIAPISADMTETRPIENAQPNSPAASEIGRKKHINNVVNSCHLHHRLTQRSF